MCVIQHNKEAVFRELYQIENTLQYQGDFLQMQVCIIGKLTSRDGLDLERAGLILLLLQA